jgi:hypothetical protein
MVKRWTRKSSDGQSILVNAGRMIWNLDGGGGGVLVPVLPVVPVPSGDVGVQVLYQVHVPGVYDSE